MNWKDLVSMLTDSTVGGVWLSKRDYFKNQNQSWNYCTIIWLHMRLSWNAKNCKQIATLPFSSGETVTPSSSSSSPSLQTNYNNIKKGSHISQHTSSLCRGYTKQNPLNPRGPSRMSGQSVTSPPPVSRRCCHRSFNRLADTQIKAK